MGKRSLSQMTTGRVPPAIMSIAPMSWNMMLHLANPNTNTLERRDELDDLCLDDDDDDLCSIDNLDACVTFEDDECCIENLEACFDEEGNTKSASLGNSNAPNQPISLERFFAQPIVEVQLAFLVVLSSLLVGLGTLSNLPPTIAVLTKNESWPYRRFLRWNIWPGGVWRTSRQNLL